MATDTGTDNNDAEKSLLSKLKGYSLFLIGAIGTFINTQLAYSFEYLVTVVLLFLILLLPWLLYYKKYLGAKILLILDIIVLIIASIFLYDRWDYGPTDYTFPKNKFTIVVARFDFRPFWGYNFDSKNRVQTKIVNDINDDFKERNIKAFSAKDKISGRGAASNFIEKHNCTMLIWRADNNKNADLAKSKIHITMNNDKIREINRKIEERLGTKIGERFSIGHVRMPTSTFYFDQTVPKIGLTTKGIEKDSTDFVDNNNITYVCDQSFEQEFDWLTKWINTLELLKGGLTEDSHRDIESAKYDAISCINLADSLYNNTGDKLKKRLKTIMLICYNHCFIALNENRFNDPELFEEYAKEIGNFRNNLEEDQKIAVDFLMIYFLMSSLPSDSIYNQITLDNFSQTDTIFVNNPQIEMDVLVDADDCSTDLSFVINNRAVVEFENRERTLNGLSDKKKLYSDLYKLFDQAKSLNSQNHFASINLAILQREQAKLSRGEKKFTSATTSFSESINKFNKIIDSINPNDDFGNIIKSICKYEIGRTKIAQFGGDVKTFNCTQLETIYQFMVEAIDSSPTYSALPYQRLPSIVRELNIECRFNRDELRQLNRKFNRGDSLCEEQGLFERADIIKELKIELPLPN